MLSKHEYDQPEGTDRPKYQKYAYSTAYDHMKDRKIEDSFSTYQDPRDCIRPSDEDIYSDFSGVNDIEEDDNEEGLYDTPYDIKEQVEELYRSQSAPGQPPHLNVEEHSTIEDDVSNESIYQNSLKLLDEIQYVDHEVLRRIQSKPDASSGHIVVERKSQIPLPRSEFISVEANNNNNKKNGIAPEIKRPLPLKPDVNKKKKSPALPLKPKPTPRPRSTYDQFDENSLNEGAPNVRDLAEHLKTKIRPIATVPNMTQAKMAASERVSYENNFTKY